MTKPQLLQVLADRLNISKNQANLYLETLSEVAVTTLKKDGTFIIPDLVKFILKDSPAKPERQGINPFTKTPITIAAKPASKKIQAKPVGDLKRMT